MFPRRIYQALHQHVQQKQITVLTGMRRTGKTTLVKQLLNDISSTNKIYLDLERLDQRELFAEKNYETIVQALRRQGISFNEKVYLALDEIQLAKNLPSVLKYLYDTYDVKCIVTGSSSFYIKNLFSESMAGRKKIFELDPLDFGEFLTFKQVPHEPVAFPTFFTTSEYERLKAYYEEFVTYGGFPEVALVSSGQEKDDLLADIVSSYVNKDIQSLADFRNIEAVYGCMKMLAYRVGTRLDASKMASLLGVTAVTVRSYIEFLEKTYCIARVPVLSNNPDREIVKAQKVYMGDNGLLRVLAKVSSGAQFENAVFTQLRHHGALRYFALKTGREIDFIFNGTMALEAKETPTQQDERNLQRLASTAGIGSPHMIGRMPAPGFHDFIWGGDIR